MKVPRIYKNKKGRHYFKFSGKKIFISRNISTKGLLAYYNALVKKRNKAQRKRRVVRRPLISNSASAKIQQFLGSSGAPVIIKQGDQEFLLKSILDKVNDNRFGLPGVPHFRVPPPGPEQGDEEAPAPPAPRPAPAKQAATIIRAPAKRLPPGRSRTSRPIARVERAVLRRVPRSHYSSVSPLETYSPLSHSYLYEDVIPSEPSRARLKRPTPTVQLVKDLLRRQREVTQEDERETQRGMIQSVRTDLQEQARPTLARPPPLQIQEGPTSPARPPPLQIQEGTTSPARPPPARPAEEHKRGRPTEDPLSLLKSAGVETLVKHEGPPEKEEPIRINRQVQVDKLVADYKLELEKDYANRNMDYLKDHAREINRINKWGQKHKYYIKLGLEKDELIAKLIEYKVNQRKHQLQDTWKLSKGVQEEENPTQTGTGGGKDPGLYDDQINQSMSRYPDYLGTISKDGIKTLLPDIKPQSRIAFIINTDKESGPGEHWEAFYIDARPEGSHSIEFFDSYGRDPANSVMNDIDLVVKMLKPQTHLKLKINRVLHQYDDTSTCGFHAMKFLIDRFRNKSFREATGFNPEAKIHGLEGKYENNIEKMKHLPEFQYM